MAPSSISPVMLDTIAFVVSFERFAAAAVWVREHAKPPWSTSRSRRRHRSISARARSVEGSGARPRSHRRGRYCSTPAPWPVHRLGPQIHRISRGGDRLSGGADDAAMRGLIRRELRALASCDVNVTGLRETPHAYMKCHRSPETTAKYSGCTRTRSLSDPADRGSGSAIRSTSAACRPGSH